LLRPGLTDSREQRPRPLKPQGRRPHPPAADADARRFRRQGRSCPAARPRGGAGGVAEAELATAHRRPAAPREPDCRSPRSGGRAPTAARPGTHGERGEARRRRGDRSAVSAPSPVVAAACPMTLPRSHHPHLRKHTRRPRGRMRGGPSAAAAALAA
jgi:hypothetical protein